MTDGHLPKNPATDRRSSPFSLAWDFRFPMQTPRFQLFPRLSNSPRIINSGVFQRISSASSFARNENPWDSKWIDSKTEVLPQPLGPPTTLIPGTNSLSNCSKLRTFWMNRLDITGYSLAGQSSRGSRVLPRIRRSGRSSRRTGISFSQWES